MITILPSVLETDLDSARKRLEELQPFFPKAQVDVVDGLFVPNATLYDAQDFAQIETPLQFEFHLMVKKCEPAIEAWAKHPNTFRILFHFEATSSPSKLITIIERHQLEVGMVINPETPISAFDHLASRLDVAQLMGVHAGFQGMEFLPETIDRVRQLHERYPQLTIQVDGGVDEKTIADLARAGATSFSIGSYFKGNIAEKLRTLNHVIEGL